MLLLFLFFKSFSYSLTHAHTLGMKQADAQTRAADRIPDNHVRSDPVIFFNRSYKKRFVAFKRPQLCYEFHFTEAGSLDTITSLSDTVSSALLSQTPTPLSESLPRPNITLLTAKTQRAQQPTLG